MTSRHGPGFWVAAAAGWGLMAFALVGILDDQPGDRVANWVAFLVGLDLVHDGLVAPLACGVGALLSRALPGGWRAPVQAGLLCSAAVLLVAAPPLAGTADFVGNPTIQPLDYRTSTLTALGIVWAGVTAVALVGSARRRRRAVSPRPGGGPPGPGPG